MYRDFQLFLKRLRKHFNTPIRYYMVGEYGETTDRPHYHACLFNIHFNDMALHSNKGGRRYYTSPILSKLWTQGNHLVCPLTPAAAQYTSLYITEKHTGQAGDIAYAGRVPPFNRMSTKPAIGHSWLERYIDDMRSGDNIRANGFAHKPPRAYDKLHKRWFPESFKETQWTREEKAWAIDQADTTPERLKVRGICATARLNQKARAL